jgi:alpha/beta superfamily hydrolase
MAKAPVTESLFISGSQGVLQAILDVPESALVNKVGIVCHPHPQHQGTMLNKVVHTLARALNDLHIPVLRFNFRGVGKSAGDYANGEGEIEDVVAVADYVSQRWPDADVWLGGFSFGAVVAARAAVQIGPQQLVTIAPAINILGEELTEQPKMPWLIVHGDADEIVPVDDVKAWVGKLEPGPELVLLPGTGHFFHGHLVDLRQTLVASLNGPLGLMN